jgi:UDP-N-acetylmuramoyl-L-alanyl-D-glutamate--2,6-diaminopimelate ligase
MIYTIDGVSYTDNSLECGKETTFVCTKTNKKYLTQAKERSAKILPLEDFAKIANHKNIQIIGITGTNGKTTTAAAIYSILIDLGIGCALQGTRGFFINDTRLSDKSLTTPSIFDTLCNIYQASQQNCAYFVMEVSSHAIVQERIEGLHFALKAHTNITQDHLDYHGSIEEYRAVKNSFLADSTPKIVNKDDKYVQFNYQNAYTYAIDNPASFVIPAYSLKEGITAGVKHFEEIAQFHSSLHGIFNISNLLCAIASVKILTQKPLQEICDEVENFAGVSGRMETVSDDPLVIVDFAHTPDGMYKVLDTLKDKTLSVVFGAGGDRDKNKRPQMGAVTSRFAKKIYITSDNPRSEDPQAIVDEIMRGISYKENVKCEVDRKKAIMVALNELQSNECLLILGKGDETTQEIGGEFIPFDDREVVRELLTQK